MKLAVLQRTLRLSSKASASRARKELRDRTRPLGDSPYNRAQVVLSIWNKATPILREHGFDGLVELLTDE